jgi:GWxTD domain-containing protein
MTRRIDSILRTARSPRGARACRGAIAAAVALLAAPGPARALDEVGDLPWRAGGRVGFTLDAATFPDSAGWTLELYVRIPPSTLAEMTRDADGAGLLALEVRLRGPFGGRWVERHEDIPFAAGDTVAGFGRVVVLRFPTRPGEHRLQARLEDMRSRKSGLAYLGRVAHEGVRVEGAFTVPRPQAERDLSDIEFVWADVAGAAAAFQRGGGMRLPNPERLYGLRASELRAFFTARSRPGDERPWRWVARVLDAGGRTVAERESTGAAGRWLTAECAFDVSTLPAGGYDLEAKAWQEGDPGALSRRARFSVAWLPDAWRRNPRDVRDDVHFLLDGEAEERFALLHPGEQEAYLEEFWRRRDPSPGTAANEARDAYMARIEHANRLYSRPGLLKGMFTDMGRVYIRYGEPSEVTHQVIPTGSETVLRVLEELERDDRRPTGDVHQKGLGGDLRPFEVWVYEAPVAPPIDVDPERIGVMRHTRLLFLFVDEQGLGHFTLRYSTE